jgi:hypothetical protein
MICSGILMSETPRMIVKQRGMMLVEFTEHFCNDGFTHKFRLVLNPELSTILIDRL